MEVGGGLVLGDVKVEDVHLEYVTAHMTALSL